MEPNERDILKFEDKVEVHQDAELKLRRKRSRASLDNIDKPLHFKNILEENSLGSDLTLSLFITALNSFRSDSCLRPFPTYFVNAHREKDFHLLQRTCHTIPPIKTIITSNDDCCSENVVTLLNWLFTEKRYPELKACSVEEVPFVFKNNKSLLIPQYIFKVCNSDKLESAWQNRVNGREIIHAYHGSTVNNFYSILNFGLQQHFSDGKEVLFGNGIYLSSELSVCMNFAPFSETWKNSALGKKLSIIALCDIINDPEKVKCKDSNYTRREQIPEKYFIVTDNELVKVSYLLVYRFKSPSFMGSFIKKYFFYIILFLYFLLLVIIGLFK